MEALISWLQASIVPIGAALTAIGVIWKTCGMPVQQLIKKIDRIDQDTADLLWDRLVQMHDFYVQRGWADTADKTRVSTIYKHYKEKGRNHLA